MFTWLLASLVTVSQVKNPLARLLIALLASAVSLTGESRTGTLKIFMVLGVTAALARCVMFGLTGHWGKRVLFHIPSITLGWLGGLHLGGDVYREVLWTALVQGIGFIAVLACIAGFVTRIGTSSIPRLLPKSMFEAALVINIAVAFGPQLIRAAGDIMDAETVRTGRRKRWRSVPSLTVPLINGALERSITLAESMDSRGFGRTPPEGAQARANVIAAVAASGALVTSVLWMMGTNTAVTGLSAIAAFLLLIWSLARPRQGIAGFKTNVLRTRRAGFDGAGKGSKRRRSLDVSSLALVGIYVSLAIAATFIGRLGVLGGTSISEVPSVPASLLSLCVGLPAILAVLRPQSQIPLSQEHE